MNSKLFSVSQKQWAKGLLLSIVGAFIGGVEGILQNGHFPCTVAELQPLAIGSVAAGVSYISHSFLSNSNGEIAKPEPNANPTN